MYIVQNTGDEPVSKRKSTDLKAYFLITNYGCFEKGLMLHVLTSNSFFGHGILTV